MAVDTFPVAFPTSGFIQSTFTPVRRQSAGVLQSGRDLVIDRGAPQWSITLKTQPLNNADTRKWLGFGRKLRGAARFFAAYDPFGEYPAAYMPKGWGSLTRAAGGAFDGTATVTTITTSGLADGGRDLITFGTLPVGFSLTAGDYVGFSQSGFLSLHSVLDVGPILANGSGVLTAWLEPELPATFTTSAVAQFYRAQGKFRMISFTCPVDAAGRARPGQATLQALSVLL